MASVALLWSCSGSMDRHVVTWRRAQVAIRADQSKGPRSAGIAVRAARYRPPAPRVRSRLSGRVYDALNRRGLKATSTSTRCWYDLSGASWPIWSAASHSAQACPGPTCICDT